MQKILFTSAVAFALFACGGAATENKDNKTEEVKTEPAATTISDNPVYQEGLALVAEPKNLCLTCHKVDEKVTGPSYRDVANKYENTPENVKMLTEKVIKGGSGVWGDIAMVPAPGLKQEDAEKMVKYILLLRNK